jgi:hypothetical protein
LEWTVLTMRRWLPGALVVVMVALAGCAGSSSDSAPVPKRPQQPEHVVAAAAQPAGTRPSESAKMVCAHEAQSDIAGVLGVKPTKVTLPTWVDHLYSCRYVYPDGVMTLSVRELDSAADTTSYFDGLATTMGRRPDNLPIGEGAFITTDGSVVVRKDYKVLTVDASQLPAAFGTLALVPTDVSTAVAMTVLGCWSGS